MDNPKSLVDLLKITRIAARGRSKTQSEMAALLEKTMRQYERPHRISPGMVSNFELNTAQLYYWQIEAYANFVGIPAGVYLLISRLLAERRRSSQTEARALLNGLKEFAGRGLQDLDKWNSGDIDDADQKDQFVLELIQSYKQGTKVTMP